MTPVLMAKFLTLTAIILRRVAPLLLYPALALSGPAYIYFVSPHEHQKYHNILAGWFGESTFLAPTQDAKIINNSTINKSQNNQPEAPNFIDNLISLSKQTVDKFVPVSAGNPPQKMPAIQSTNWQWATGKELLTPDGKTIIVVHQDGSCSLRKSDAKPTDKTSHMSQCHDDVFYQLDLLKKRLDGY